MELGLKGKTVIVTGGGSNIGRAIVHAFGREGCNIAIAEIDLAQGESVAEEVAKTATGGKAVVVKTDVSDDKQVEEMVNRVVGEFGGVDVLVNNVGWTVDRLFMQKPREEWEREVRLNLWSPINCTRAVLPHMIDRQAGSIVSISSDAGRMGEYREAVYSACKAGVIGLSKAVAREMGRYGIRLNVVCPDSRCPNQKRRRAARACGFSYERSSRRRSWNGSGGATCSAAWARQTKWLPPSCFWLPTHPGSSPARPSASAVDIR